MPKSIDNSSIKNVWENNPDTPLVSTRLSMSVDHSSSYLNADEVYSLHAENSILFAHPTDNAKIVLKKGTVIQITNLKKDNFDQYIVSKNDHYRLFETGLEDIEISFTQTDDTHADKTSWGGGTKHWFVYLCDKNDTQLENKNTPDEYGGGAQILISLSNKFPVGQVPGNVGTGQGEMYNEKDTRLIGGFTTSGNIILSESIWDIAGKFQVVKAKSFYIIDEHNENNSEPSPVYRKIRLQDIDTQGSNSFAGSVTVNGNITTNDAFINGNITHQGNLNQTGSLTVASDDKTFSINDTNVSINNRVSIVGDFHLDGSISVVNEDATNALSFNGTDRFTFYNATSILNNTTISGNLQQSGDATLGGNLNTISSLGTFNHVGDFSINGDYLNVNVFPSGAVNIKGATNVENSTGDVTFSVDPANETVEITSTLNQQGDVSVNGNFIQSGGRVSLTSFGDNLRTFVPSGMSFVHSGNFTVTDEPIVTFQSSNNDTLASFDTANNLVEFHGSFNNHINDSSNFIVQSSTGDTIISATQTPNKNVYINDNLFIGSTLNVGSTLIVGGVELSGGGFTGNASTADRWSTPMNLRLTNGVIGEASFDGSENSVEINATVVSSEHNHNDIYYTQTELNNGQLDNRYYTEAEINTNFYTRTDFTLSGSNMQIDWGNINDETLPVTSPFTQPPPHNHDDRYIQFLSVAFNDVLNIVDVDGTRDSSLIAPADHLHDIDQISGTENLIIDVATPILEERINNLNTMVFGGEVGGGIVPADGSSLPDPNTYPYSMDLGRYYDINDGGAEVFRRFDNVFADTVDTNYVDLKDSDQILENSDNKLQLLFNDEEIDVRTYRNGTVIETRKVAYKEETYSRSEVDSNTDAMMEEIADSLPWEGITFTNPFTGNSFTS